MNENVKPAVSASAPVDPPAPAAEVVAPSVSAPPAQPQDTAPNPAGDAAAPASSAKVDALQAALRDVYDPEIPINIVDLGLIYKLEENDGAVNVEMTLTSPHCPIGDQIKAQVTDVLSRCPDVKSVNVTLTFEPLWSKEKLTFEGKLQAAMLGIM